MRRILTGLLQLVQEDEAEFETQRSDSCGCNHGRDRSQRGQSRHMKG